MKLPHNSWWIKEQRRLTWHSSPVGLFPTLAIRVRILPSLPGATPIAAREALTNRQMANEALMLSLRQQSGLDVTAWERRWNLCWGNRREAISAQLDREGKARWADQRLTLTPKGFLLADEATAQLMVD